MTLNIEIIKDRMNRMLDRREVKFKIIHNESGTPSRERVYEELSKILRTEKQKMFIPYIRSLSGLRISLSLAYIFMNGYDISQIEPRYRRKLEEILSGKEKPKEESKET